jgi:poly-gamma-glutamate capsule biosynthesis protein CapA/YwtB (metallophosphatase superfamily)
MARSGNGFVLLAVGDVAPLHPLDDASSMSGEVWNYLRSADLVTANLELPLTAGGSRADKAITLRAEPEVASSLHDVGIGLVTVANNHALDYGAEGLHDTLSALRDASVVAVGGGRNLEEATQPALVSVGEASVAVFGLASTLPPGFAAGPERPGIAPVRARSSFYVDAVTLDEQPGLIAYSLGHFLFHSMSEDRETELTKSYPPYDVSSLQTGEARQSVILELEVAGNRMASVRFKPVRMNARGEPEFAKGTEAVAALGRMTEHSSRMNTRVELRNREAYVAL